ncbi:hypothetical protein Dimus_013518 [Dionaea muscipula]
MKRETVEDVEFRVQVEYRRSSRLSPSLSSSIPDLGGVVEDGLPSIVEVGESIEAEAGDGDSSEKMVSPSEEVGDCLRGEVAGLRGPSLLPDLSPISELQSMGRGSRPSISRSPSFSLEAADGFCQNAMDAAGFGSSLPTGTVSPVSASVIPLGGDDQTAAIGVSAGLRDGDWASSGAPL